MPQPRPGLRHLPPCPHGGPDLAEMEELGLSPNEVMDFSVNCNPFGPPPGVKAAAERTSWDRLPDPQAAPLRRALADKLGLRPANIVVGNGSVELIRFLALALFEAGDTVAISTPTFGEYELSLHIAGASPLLLPAPEEGGFQHNLVDLARVLRDGARGMFLCNPNNPTGVYLSRQEVEVLLEASPESLLILDEAYMPFVDGAWDSLELLERGNLVVLRSMTKDYALGGLRLGYTAGPEHLMEALRLVLPPWNVNAIAQEAGILALKDDSYPARCLPAILEAREYLRTELTRLGLHPWPSKANFFLVEVGDATAWRKALLRKGCLVRDCTSFGLPRYVRIAPRTMEECRLLVEALGGLVAQGTLRP